MLRQTAIAVLTAFIATQIASCSKFPLPTPKVHPLSDEMIDYINKAGATWKV